MHGRELQNRRTWRRGKRPPSHKPRSSQRFTSLTPPLRAWVMEKLKWQCRNYTTVYASLSICWSTRTGRDVFQDTFQKFVFGKYSDSIRKWTRGNSCICGLLYDAVKLRELIRANLVYVWFMCMYNSLIFVWHAPITIEKNMSTKTNKHEIYAKFNCSSKV
jgi:hypothetical protein